MAVLEFLAKTRAEMKKFRSKASTYVEEML